MNELKRVWRRTSWMERIAIFLAVPVMVICAITSVVLGWTGQG